MVLLKKKLKKEPSVCSCSSKACHAEPLTAATSTCCNKPADSIRCIKVLGAGCKNCRALYENAKQAANSLGLDVEVEYVTDLEKVMAYGVMTMPVLVVNERVAAAGRVLKPKEIEMLLKS